MSGTSENKAAGVPSSPLASPAGAMPEVEDSPSLKFESPAAGLNDRWLVPGVCIFLAAITFAVFGQTLRYEFVNFDDNLYVYENSVVQKGLTWEGFHWALTYGKIGHWHPLTWLSHMLDCQWYGLSPCGHHLTNVLLHGAAVILLFLVLREMTGFLWRSAFVAAVFAIHPLRAESVAWVAERKDVLSAFFFMLTLGAYVRFVRRPPSKIRYGAVVLFFALGLLSKNMLVTTPFVLLLLDYWPLNRLSGFSLQALLRRVAEKIPLFILTIGSCVATALVPEKLTNGQLPFGLRMENVVVSYVTYLWQMIHPLELACVYPNPVNHLPLWQVAGALGLLLAISGAVWAVRRTQPGFVVGWLWYLGMMVPVIGLVQISYYAHADRYTYLPQIGLYLLLTWGAANLCASWRYRRVALGGGSAIILMTLMVCARTQTAYWRNSELLWTHALACTSGNYIAHDNLANALPQKEVDQAIAHYQEALLIKPNYAEAHNNLANALLQKGKMDEAIAHCQQALLIKPDYAEAHINLGIALLQKGDADEAITQFQTALQIKPDYAEAHYNLGNALLQKGQADDAIPQYQTALQINPGYAEAHHNLGSALLQKGRPDEAIAQYQMALQIKPDYAGAWYNLGNALLQKGNVDEAIAHYQQALQINPSNAEAHNILGNTLLSKGRVDEAIVHYQQALQISPDNAEAHNNLGNVMLQKGQVDEAIIHYQQALQIKPHYAKAHNNLGSALFQKGQVDEAIIHFQQALQIKPDYAEAHNNLGNVLFQKGNVDEAIIQLQQAVQITPDNAKAHNNLGNALLKKDRIDEAIAHYQMALQIKPDSLGVLNNLAWLLATCPDAHIRDGVQAVKYALRACELTHYGVAPLVGTLAAAYAEAGRYDDAIAAAQKACALATAAGERDLLEKNQKLLTLYRAHQPYHEAAGQGVPTAP
jgi:tetratricopeptide (TPR) repeat protein